MSRKLGRGAALARSAAGRLPPGHPYALTRFGTWGAAAACGFTIRAFVTLFETWGVGSGAKGG
jgi:hypothetical protein